LLCIGVAVVFLAALCDFGFVRLTTRNIGVFEFCIYVVVSFMSFDVLFQREVIGS